MCGIAGILSYPDRHPPSHREITQMTHTLLHRGPDASDVWVNGPVGFGHTRLSIIDIQGGRQPMKSRDGMLSITYNGEIFNFKELRNELEGLGFKFYTSSDTEVVLNAYQYWKEDCVNKLNGMFAFCIADLKEKSLFLARDHAGIKPLFYRVGKDFFAFASGLEAFKSMDAPLPEGSLQSIDYFLRYQYIPAPDTIYKNIYKLPPAHSMSISFKGVVAEPRRYWRIRFLKNEHTQREIIEQLKDAVKKAVNRAMIADVPVGVLCSGGMDSSLITYYAHKNAGSSLKAFSMGFDEQGYSELSYAKKVAKQFDLEFYHEVLDDGAMDVLPDLVRHYGEPFGDSSAVPTFHLSRMARSHVSTVLSGDGGDEIFGGYDRFFAWVNQGRWNRLRRNQFRLDLKVGRFKTIKSILDLLGFGPDEWSQYIYQTQYHQRFRLWRPEFRTLIDTPSKLFWEAYSHAQKLNGMAYVQSMDFETYLPGAVLTKVDVASMYHGLEVRPPLLDKDLIELASQLPISLKYQGGSYGKIALQKILEKKIPDICVNRPKMGFGIPRWKWLLPGSRGNEMINDYVRGTSSPLADWFSRDHIKWHIKMHSKTQDNSHHLWLLLVLAIWADQNRQICFS